MSTETTSSLQYGSAPTVSTDRRALGCVVGRTVRKAPIRDGNRIWVGLRLRGLDCGAYLDSAQLGCLRHFANHVDMEQAIVEASAHHLHVVGKAKAPLEAAGHMAGVRGFRCPALARCSAGPWVRVRLNAVLTRATCENACGKFPTWRPRRGSNSSANRPTSNMLQPTSGIETRIYRLFLLRVELYINCHWRANVERSQVPCKIFERGPLWQYKR